MSVSDDPKTLRTMVSMPENFTKKMQNYADEKDIKFSSLIRNALKLYTNDENNCFVEIAQLYSGHEAADKAAEMLSKHNIIQSHFLGHIVREASSALNKLKDGDDWHKIRCVLDQKIHSDYDPETDPRVQAMVKKMLNSSAKERQGKSA